ncbi:MAG: M28 family peptidase [Candidatus Coatesbacteria bacterium]|nr:MAG: M28 family peptidase [Candidatus Coatesbacteria bacterium]
MSARRIGIFACVAAAGAAGAAAAFSPAPTLLAVELARPAAAYELLARGAAVVEARPSFALVLASPGEAAALDGYAYVDLGPPEAPVYLAWPRPGEALPPAEGVTVLAVFGGAHVVAGEAAAVEPLARRGVELKRVTLEPVRPPRPRALPALAYDPLVAEVVRRVRADRYFDHIERLAAVGTRYSHAEEIERATAYIEDHFRSLGYETARRPYLYEPMDNDYLLDCVFRANGRLGWLVSTWGYVWRSGDAGKTWTAYKSEGRLAQAKFITDTVGFVVGGIGFLGRTDDGGRTWRQLPLQDPTDDLRDIYFYDTRLGLAGGLDGALYRTADGGASWAKVATPTTKHVLGVYAETADRWWALGVEGLVMRSYDGGRTWAVINVPAAAPHTMRQIAFADATHATMVGYDGTILYSEDAGGTWRRVSGYFPTWPYFTEVAFADASRGWAVGSTNRVYVTENGGASWARQSPPPSDYRTFEGLSVVSREEAWAVGYPSAVIHTTDGGARWEEVRITNSVPIIWYNVEAVKPGVTRPNQIYVLCGHYDSISGDPWNLAPGAEDNASGTAAVLEAATALADYRFDGTLKFLAFSGEEEGLLGSRAYVRKEHAAGADIRAALNMDMVAYLDEPVHDVEVRYNDFSEELLNRYRAAARLYVPSYAIYPATEGRGGSDHEPFWEFGYPALLSVEHPRREFYPWYHTTEDLPKHLTAAFGADVTRVNVAVAASLAGLREGPSPSSEGVIAYPNPARPSAGHNHIRFANLAPGGSVVVYNLAGEEVYRLGPVAAHGSAEWPLRTAAGGPAASGLYLFVVEDVDGGRTFGKVAVIR